MKNSDGHDIIVIGASAGGVEALMKLVKDLPQDIPAAIFIVIHTSPTSRNFLPEILSREGPLPAIQAVDYDTIQYGRIYIAPPDHHLLLENRTIRVTRGPKENRCRPAVDPLFRTSAYAYGPRVIGVVLTGILDDGTHGLYVIKSYGGIAVVQDPNDAAYPDMPQSALKNVKVDYCVPLTQIAPLLVRLAHEPVTMKALQPHSDKAEVEVEISKMKGITMEDMRTLGRPSSFTCPSCHGNLWEVSDENLTHFICRVGHSYSPQALLEDQTENAEASLWAAVRSLEESADLYRQMAEKEQKFKNYPLAHRYEQKVRDTSRHIETIRKILLKRGKPKI